VAVSGKEVAQASLLEPPLVLVLLPAPVVVDGQMHLELREPVLDLRIQSMERDGGELSWHEPP
jgi:hypothetical protein